MAYRKAVLLCLLMICGFAVVGQLYVMIPLSGEIATRFDVGTSDAALAASAFGFAYAGGFLLFGSLSDRFGRKPVILWGLGAVTVTTLLVAMAPGYEMFIAARVLQGLAASTFPPAVLSLIAEELPPSQRPVGISLMSFAFLGAAPVAQLLGAKIVSVPVLMLGVAPVYVLGAAGLMVMVRSKTGAQHAAPKAGRPPLLRDAAIPAAWFAAFTVLFGFVSFQAGVQAMNGTLGLDLQRLRLLGLPPLLLTLVAAPLTRRLGAPTTARIGLVIMAAALTIAALGGGASIMVGGVILSCGVALAVPGLIATVAGRAAPQNRGVTIAIYTFCLFLGASIAPPVALWLSPYGLAILWLTPASLLGISVALITAIISRPSLPKPVSS